MSFGSANDEGDSGSEVASSDSDDRLQPGYYLKSRHFHLLPENVRAAVALGQEKAKHSEFYYKMKELTDKIAVYKKIFDNRVPAWQRQYNKKKLQQTELLQEKERELFKKEMEQLNKKKLKLKKFQSAAEVLIPVPAPGGIKGVSAPRGLGLSKLESSPRKDETLQQRMAREKQAYMNSGPSSPLGPLPPMKKGVSERQGGAYDSLGNKRTGLALGAAMNPPSPEPKLGTLPLSLEGIDEDEETAHMDPLDQDLQTSTMIGAPKSVSLRNSPIAHGGLKPPLAVDDNILNESLDVPQDQNRAGLEAVYEEELEENKGLEGSSRDKREKSKNDKTSGHHGDTTNAR